MSGRRLTHDAKIRKPGVFLLVIAAMLGLFASGSWRSAHAAPATMTGSDHDRMAMPDAPSSPAARDPNAYSDGHDFGPMRPHLADEKSFSSFLIDRLETARTRDNTAAAYGLQAWYGRDFDRAVLKAEGRIDNGGLDEARTELAWGHAVAPYWDVLTGVRHDSGMGPSRTWLAVGVQGLAPYWFEVDATGYLGEAGHTALKLEAEYELLFTQRLILQPRLELNFYGQDDAEREIGAGLSELASGVRLRYELRREFAPYIGLEWAGRFGATADYDRAAGQDSKDTRVVAGVRLWF